MRLRGSIYIIVSVCLAAACNSNDKPIAKIAPPVVTKPVLAEPFKYHKMVEVAPGSYYDVLSWGRGTKDGGQYMILRSDSSDQKYDAVNGDLEGPVKDVLNTDLDTDGNPEIIIYAQSIDTNRYINVFVYEYQNANARKIDFPRLTETQRKGYRGGDDFYIKDNKLMREFPVYTGKGKEAILSGQKRTLQYSLQSNTLYAKQVSIDSALVNKTEEKVVAPQQKVSSASTQKASSKKHHTESHTKARHKEAVKKHHKKRR